MGMTGGWEQFLRCLFFSSLNSSAIFTLNVKQTYAVSHTVTHLRILCFKYQLMPTPLDTRTDGHLFIQSHFPQIVSPLPILAIICIYAILSG